jgi:hypothetical protein
MFVNVENSEILLRSVSEFRFDYLVTMLIAGEAAAWEAGY